MRSIGAIEAVQSFVPDALVVPFLLLTRLGDPLLAVGVLLLGYWFGDRTRGVRLLGILAGGLALGLLAKSVFALPRPPVSPPVAPEAIPELLRSEYVDTVRHQEGPGFPSGHAVTATVLWGIVAAKVRLGTARVRYGLAGTVVAVVCLSRLVLGVHYLVDVLVGALLGGGYLMVAFGVLDDPAVDPRTILAAAVVLAAVGTVVSGFREVGVAGTGAALGAFLGWSLSEAPPDPWPASPGGYARGIFGIAGVAVIAAAGVAVGGDAPLFVSTACAIGFAMALPELLQWAGVGTPTVARPNR